MSASTGSASTLEHVRMNPVGLKMARALEMLEVTVKGLERGELSSLEAIDVLLSEELTMRENRRVKVALMSSRLTQVKTLEQYDFSFQPSIDRNQILTLAQLGFIERKEVVHFLGPPGTGKSHLAIALGVEAIKAGKSVYMATLAEIIASLLKAEREGTLPGASGSSRAQHFSSLTRWSTSVLPAHQCPVRESSHNPYQQPWLCRVE